MLSRCWLLMPLALGDHQYFCLYWFAHCGSFMYMESHHRCWFFFCTWLLSLGIFARFIHAVARITITFLFIAECWITLCCIDILCFIWVVSIFWLLWVIPLWALMYRFFFFLTWKHVFSFLGYTPVRWIAVWCLLWSYILQHHCSYCIRSSHRGALSTPKPMVLGPLCLCPHCCFPWRALLSHHFGFKSSVLFKTQLKCHFLLCCLQWRSCDPTGLAY